MTSLTLSPGSTCTLELADLAAGGEAVGRLDSLVLFVPFGAPGDQVSVSIDQLKKQYGRGRILSVLRPSPDRVPPACPLFTRCGGCQIQHLTYDAQLKWKTKIVADAVARIGSLPQVPVRPCVASPSPWGYRNKAQLVAAGAAGRIVLGLFEQGSHDVVPIETCPIQHDLNNRILSAATVILRDVGWDGYNEITGKGLLRHLLVRTSTGEPQAVVVVVTTQSHAPRMEEFARRLQAAVPEVRGVLQNVNVKQTNVILGSVTKLIAGEPYLTETVDDRPFQVTATGFFQVNGSALPALVGLVREAAGPVEGKVLLDAYAGVGTLALSVGRTARIVVAVEEDEGACTDAQTNAEAQGMSASFVSIAKPVEAALAVMARKGKTVDVLILDPPRRGCAEAVMESIPQLGVERIAYVSCNPATLARDLAKLAVFGYETQWVTPLDLFPQTAHVEAVACLIRKGARDAAAL